MITSTLMGKYDNTITGKFKTISQIIQFNSHLFVAARLQSRRLVADVLAGLTLWGLVVPEGMAYAGVAGLPPQFGLYTLVASLLVYALFGSSRHLSVGATSATAALIASTWVTLAVGATPLALLFLLPRWNKKIPAGLEVLFGSIAISAALNLNAGPGDANQRSDAVSEPLSVNK